MKLGVVRAVDAFVAEVLAELEHLVHATDEEALEVELGRNAHHAVLVERVEVREERLCRSTARLILENRGLDLDEALVPEVLPDLHDEPRAREEALARLVVRHEIDIAATIAFLLIGEPVELLRRLLERLGEHRPLLDDDRLLALLRREENALRADDVAEVELLEGGERRLGKLVALEDELKAVGAVVHGAEVHLAHAADHEKTASDADRLPLLESLPGDLEVDVVVLAAVGLVAHFLQRPH